MKNTFYTRCRYFDGFLHCFTSRGSSSRGLLELSTLHIRHCGFHTEWKTATMYVITAALVLGVLHSYLGCRPLRYWFRSWVLVHQVTYAGLLLWRYVCAETRDQAGTGLRLFLLCFCALGAANDHTFKFLDHLMPQMATYPRV